MSTITFITAANASSISDGAAALVVMAAEKARMLGVQPLVKIIGYGALVTES